MVVAASDSEERALKPAEGQRPVVLTIAGFDPSSGAGITADLKVFAAYGCFGISCITALTVQSTQGVRNVEAVGGRWTAETLRWLQEDVSIDAVKIGMLATKENTEAVADFLTQVGIARERIVLDPVLISSSGALLLEPAGVVCLRDRLLAQVGWITPNLDELAALTGMPTLERQQVVEAAGSLQELALLSGNKALNVLVTGGHLEKPDDYLLPVGSSAGVWIPGEWVETTATHGTGCALSSALACELLAGLSAVAAVEAAKRYVEQAMRKAYRVGQGRGPLHHLFKLDAL